MLFYLNPLSAVNTIIFFNNHNKFLILRNVIRLNIFIYSPIKFNPYQSTLKRIIIYSITHFILYADI